MFRIQRSNPWPPTMDLSTIRETMEYMHSDMKRVPGLEKAAKAVAAALKEIDEAEQQAATTQKLNPLAAKFLPRRTFENPSRRSN